MQEHQKFKTFTDSLLSRSAKISELILGSWKVPFKKLGKILKVMKANVLQSPLPSLQNCFHVVFLIQSYELAFALLIPPIHI